MWDLDRNIPVTDGLNYISSSVWQNWPWRKATRGWSDDCFLSFVLLEGLKHYDLSCVLSGQEHCLCLKALGLMKAKNEANDFSRCLLMNNYLRESHRFRFFYIFVLTSPLKVKLLNDRGETPVHSTSS